VHLIQGEIVKKVLIDTDTISLFLRNDINVVKNFSIYLSEFERINFSIISYYEILSGLKYKDAKKQLNSFLEFSEYNSILPLTKESIEKSASIYATLRTQGHLIDDIDILIAGIAISNDLKLISHNQNHFKRIEGLDLDDWTILK
jgi:tRNA(fMet)-specific endonuclease VapC